MPEQIYRETISRTVTADYTHKAPLKDGKGEFARVVLRLQPLERGQGFDFVNEIVGGVVAKEYIGSVERGVKDAAKSGVLNGGEVVDCRVALCGGAYHDIDSNDQTFYQAAQGAFRKAMKNAGPKLLFFT